MKTFTHNVTRVKDPDTGVWNELPSISGKTAYQYALDGGYTGTEEEFKAKMAAEYLTAADLDPYAKTEALSAPITEAEIREVCTDVVDGSGSIPIATKSTIGCVAVGAGLDVDENGVVSPSVDYIMDQGTSGDWVYRKWNSGIAELWSTVSVPYANEYVCYKKIDLPNECALTEIVCITATPNSDGGNISQFLPTNVKAYAKSISVIPVAVHNSAGGWSSSFSIPVSLHIIARWK